MPASPSAPRANIDRRLVAAGLLALLAFGLRLFRLDYQSLWYDELSSYYQTAYLFASPPPGLDPGFYLQARTYVYVLAVKPWLALIDSAFGLRWPSLLAGTLAVAVTFRVGEALGGRRAGLLAALLLAVSPTHLYYAQEARPYALVLLGSLVSLWALTLLERRGRRARWAGWAYTLSVTLTAAIHVVAALWLVVQGVWLALRGRLWKTPQRRVWSASLLGILAVSSAIVSFDSRFGLNWFTRPLPRDAAFIIWQAVGLEAKPEAAEATWILPTRAVFLLLLGLGTLSLSRLKATPLGRYNGRSVALLLLALTVLPILALYALSYLVVPLWLPRYLMASMMTLLLWVALAAAHLQPRRWGGLLVACVLAGSLAGDLRYYFDPDYQRHNWRGAAHYVADHYLPGDLVLVYMPGRVHVMNFYLADTSIETAPLGLGSDAEQVARMRTSLDDHRRVWVAWDFEPDEAATWMGLVARDVSRTDYVDLGRLKLYLYQNT